MENGHNQRAAQTSEKSFTKKKPQISIYFLPAVEVNDCKYKILSLVWLSNFPDLPFFITTSIEKTKKKKPISSVDFLPIILTKMAPLFSCDM